MAIWAKATDGLWRELELNPDAEEPTLENLTEMLSQVEGYLGVKGGEWLNTGQIISLANKKGK